MYFKIEIGSFVFSLGSEEKRISSEMDVLLSRDDGEDSDSTPEMESVISSFVNRPFRADSTGFDEDRLLADVLEGVSGVKNNDLMVTPASMKPIESLSEFHKKRLNLLAGRRTPGKGVTHLLVKDQPQLFVPKRGFLRFFSWLK
jgi:hypothetical protein